MFVSVYLESHHEETDYNKALIKQQMRIHRAARYYYEQSPQQHCTGDSESCETQKLLIGGREWKPVMRLAQLSISLDLNRGNALSTQSLSQTLENTDEISLNQNAAALKYKYRSQESAVLQVSKPAVCSQMHGPLSTSSEQFCEWVDEKGSGTTIMDCVCDCSLHELATMSGSTCSKYSNQYLDSINTHVHLTKLTKYLTYNCYSSIVFRS